MKDLAVALALAIALEGMAYALFPDAMKRMAARMQDMPPQMLRAVGLGAAVAGVAVLAVLRRGAIAG